MSLTRLKIIQLVLTILYIKTEVHKIFTDQGISSVRKLLNNKYETYQYLMYKKLSKLLPTDIEKSPSSVTDTKSSLEIIQY